MVGSELPTPETRESTVTDVVVLDLQGLTVANPRPEPATSSTTSSFTVHRGEIVGIAGVEGNGQCELVKAIVGLAAVDRHDRSSTAIDITPQHRRANDATAASGTSPRTARRTAS